MKPVFDQQYPPTTCLALSDEVLENNEKMPLEYFIGEKGEPIYLHGKEKEYPAGTEFRVVGFGIEAIEELKNKPGRTKLIRYE